MSNEDMSDDTGYPAAGPLMSTSGVSPDADTWRTLTPLLLARPRIRVSRDSSTRRRGGYPLRWEVPFPPEPPTRPAAGYLYTVDGLCPTLVLDLDASRGGVDAVHRDAATIRRLIATAGGHLISDGSITGGMHLYLPLEQPVPFHEARDVALAVARHAPTVDTTPNVNLAGGLIRPPGSAHRFGGRQTLHGLLSDAVDIATRRNPETVWRNLTDSIADTLTAVRGEHREPAPDGDATPDPPFPSRRHHPALSPRCAAIAATGDYDPARYRSPSEARQAVITAATDAGMSFTDVVARIETGAWPGLAALYRRYSRPKHAVARDWRSAVSYLRKRPGQQAGTDLVRTSPTSGHNPHGGIEEQVADPSAASLVARRRTDAEYIWLRQWWAALVLAERDRYTTRAGLARRMLLRALGAAAMQTGVRQVAFGVRSLSVAAGIDHTTAADHLRYLRSEPDPMIQLVESAHGLAADVYLLRIPDSYQSRAEREPWRAGKIHALRPVFLALGVISALVYEALEHHHRRDRLVTSFDIATTSGLSRSSVWDGLNTLQAWNLAEQRHGQWRLIPSTSLTGLARLFGVDQTVRRRVERHRVERRLFRQFLIRAHRLPPAGRQRKVTAGTLECGPPPDDPPPDDDYWYTAMDLLAQGGCPSRT